jgi:hypothetical protein
MSFLPFFLCKTRLGRSSQAARLTQAVVEIDAVFAAMVNQIYAVFGDCKVKVPCSFEEK